MFELTCSFLVYPYGTCTLSPRTLPTATKLEDIHTAYTHKHQSMQGRPLYLTTCTIRGRVRGPLHPTVVRVELTSHVDKSGVFSRLSDWISLGDLGDTTTVKSGGPDSSVIFPIVNYTVVIFFVAIAIVAIVTTIIVVRWKRKQRNLDRESQEQQSVAIALLEYPTVRESGYPSRNVRESEYPNRTVRESEYPNRTVRESEYPSRSVRELEYPSRIVRESEYPRRIVRESEYPSRTVRESEYPSRIVRESDYPSRNVREYTTHQNQVELARSDDPSRNLRECTRGQEVTNGVTNTPHPSWNVPVTRAPAADTGISAFPPSYSSIVNTSTSNDVIRPADIPAVSPPPPSYDAVVRQAKYQQKREGTRYNLESKGDNKLGDEINDLPPPYSG
ncbi:uncharacterized protein LOC131934854 [Physella acuta]|uniref:uncharacterized protein LOC131934854 n=1 Tax=Physella acuta TaxID=109671 RepID=UPI0027DD69BC|nr:uncharacterized protein LOC131934854 [Physella acuta]